MLCHGGVHTLTGPAVIFLHGFPEIWYSWRHQMVALAAAGFHAIAPDWRGYGLSDQPPHPENATYMDLIADLLAILDLLHIPKAFVVGKDFGAMPAYLFALMHPERVSGVITLGIPYMLPSLRKHTNQHLPKGFYIRRWQEPGRAEADFGRFDVRTVIRNIYILFSGSELPIAGDDQEIMDLVHPSTVLPNWFSEEDLNVYASLYENSGFRFPLEVPYRCIKRSFKEADHSAATDLKVRVPALLVMGRRDYFLKFPGIEDYINSPLLKENVPDLKIVFMPEGTHFVQEQLPEEINQLIIDFLKKHTE
ncbi:uncharacterized protein LOC18423155 [Amborella trichopoda]|uniref:AB hydrolase-1 domain-containing protein n=1 Tax=Amborella trichopoda TaxID=13333 RepID=W1NIB4_AMBTC|nr:uncharacterized protein LOC18423155 [Amborella trichopoda]ERM95228.1 hypothetical protein AMTR_s00009p00268110 [Amborella trichopoda]|eukprot:XP_006827812.1 uncharacterized protein LOC18423155 [Amborella trichopoda]